MNSLRFVLSAKNKQTQNEIEQKKKTEEEAMKPTKTNDDDNEPGKPNNNNLTSTPFRKFSLRVLCNTNRFFV